MECLTMMNDKTNHNTNKIMEHQIELYQENGLYCAYISTDGSSGYEIAEKTVEERAEAIKNYFLDFKD